jgi:integrase
MTATKRYTPPPPKAKEARRATGAGKLSLHVQRGADGKAEPYRLAAKDKPLWKFTLRTEHGCRNIAAATWAEAERLSGTAAEDLTKKPAAVPTTATRTVGDLCEAFLAARGHKDSKTRDRTVAGYRASINAYILPFWKDVPVSGATPAMVSRWKAKHVDENDDRKSRTRAARVCLLSMVFRHGVDSWWLPQSPVVKDHVVLVLKVGENTGKVKGDQRVTAPFTAAELDAIVGKLDADDPALRLMVTLTGQMGFRLREANHIRVEDVKLDLDGAPGFIEVASGRACDCWDCRRNGNVRLNKAGKSRLVPIPPGLVAAVRRHLQALSDRFGPGGLFLPVWRAKAGQIARPGQIRVPKVVSAAFVRAATAAGRPDLIFHDLRGHAKGALRKQAGANNDAIDKALGHKLPGMSEIYVTFTPAELYHGCYPAWTPPLALVKVKAG